MIKYNIDNYYLNTIEEPQTMIVMVVEGWFFSDSVKDADIKINIDEPYRIQRFVREDVNYSFKIKDENLFAGFKLEVCLYSNRSDIEFDLTDGAEVEHIHLNFNEKIKNKIKLYTKEIKSHKYGLFSAARHTKKCKMLYGGSLCDDIFYNFDECIYVKEFHELVLQGWQFGKSKDSILSVEDAEIINDNLLNRTDVAEIFGLEDNKKKCGFDYRIKVFGEKVIIKITNPQVGQIKVCIPTDAIDGGDKDAETILSANTEKEYIKKYGKDGIKLKKIEKQIFYRESILNSRPYERIKYNACYNINKISLSLIIAVNSKDYAEKLDSFFGLHNSEGIEVICVGNNNVLERIYGKNYSLKKVFSEETDKFKLIFEGIKQAKKEYVMIMDQEDYFEIDFLKFIAEQQDNDYDCIYSDYDLVYNDESIIRVNRDKDFSDSENAELLITACVIKKDIISECDSIFDIKDSLKKINLAYHIDVPAYHFNVVQNNWNDEKTKAIAFYLTQYHITEENNKWWGEGFTEWKNVKRGLPMFEGHDQPRVPTDLGYYDLVEDKKVQYKQIELANKFGVYGFCYYYYWFEGKRLLRKPLDQFVQNKELNLPYCICWANETWSKRWDGLEHEILMQQVHNEKTDVEFIYDIIPMFNDERYIKIDGRPLLLIYRFDLFPYPNKTIKTWREICKKEGIGDIHISIVQAFDAVDHRIYGADSSVEFPPHKISAIPDITITEKMVDDDSDFKGNIFSYKRVVENMSTIEKRDYKLFPGAMLKWDNTARKMNASNIFHEFTPELYRRWLIKNHHYTRMYNEDNIMFINAWNEWAEGSYLEPDETNGTKLLEITNEVCGCK